MTIDPDLADADRDPHRWSNTVFTNPRFLQFHTGVKAVTAYQM